MAWRDDLLKASWRGAPFYVTSSKTTAGRRTELHELPASEAWHVEDLGASARKYSIEGYVLGADYIKQRQRLEKELARPGPGELVHPYYGTIEVQLEGESTVSESESEGGIARFSMTFVEVSIVSPIIVHVSEDKAAVVVAAADDLDAAIDDDLAAAVSIVSEVARVYDDALSMVQTVASTLRAAVGAVQGMIANIEQAVAAVEAVADQVDDLVALPGQLSAAIRGAIASVQSAVGGIVGALADAFGSGDDARAEAQATLPAAVGPLDDMSRAQAALLIDARLATVPDTWAADQSGTATRETMAANRAALRRTLLAARATSLVRVVSDGLVLEDTTIAAALRDRVVAILAELQLEPGLSDAASAALVDLRRAWVDLMRDALAETPKSRTLEVTATKPALVIAYEEHGDPARADEIARRNSITHMGFVATGSALRLIDA